MATALAHHLQSVHKYYHNRPQYCLDAFPTARGRRITVWDRLQLQGSRSSNSSVWQRLGPTPTKPKVNGLVKCHHRMLPVPTPPKSKHNYLSHHVVQKNFAKPPHAKLDNHETKYSSTLATTTSQRSKLAQTKSSPILKPREKKQTPVQNINKIKDKVAPINIKKSGCEQSSGTNANPKSPLKPPNFKSATPLLKHQNAHVEADTHESVKERKHNEVDTHESVKETKHDEADPHESVKERKHNEVDTPESVKETKHDKENVTKPCTKRKATDVNTDSDCQATQPLKRHRAITAYKHNHIHCNNAATKKRKRTYLM